MPETAWWMLGMMVARAPNSYITILCPTNMTSASRLSYLGSRINESFAIGRRLRTVSTTGRRFLSVECVGVRLARRPFAITKLVFFYGRNASQDDLTTVNMAKTVD
ncbi:hypothetical protein TrVGV298_007815 [Trichoderma virens]|nr:hypothetical protein TrVGV298_007815 [Trichoderma virens]